MNTENDKFYATTMGQPRLLHCAILVVVDIKYREYMHHFRFAVQRRRSIGDDMIRTVHRILVALYVARVNQRQYRRTHFLFRCSTWKHPSSRAF